MQISRKDINACTISLEIVCEPDVVKSAFDRAFRHLTKAIKLPGFRPGAAPRPMLEPLISESELTEQAASEVVTMTLNKAIEQESIRPDVTTQPQINITALDRGEMKAEYTAKIPLPPVVELGDYKSLKMVVPVVDVSEEEVERQIVELRKQGQRREAVTDRGVEPGDVAVVSISPVDESSGSKSFMVVVGQTFPVLDGAVLGMKLEEVKNVTLTFPAKFQEKEWAGQTMEVRVSIDSLSAVRLAEMDENFFKAFRAESEEQLKELVRNGVQRAKTQMSREIFIDSVLDEIRTQSKVEVSDNMWEALAMRRLRETQDEQRKQNRTLDQYAKENGMTVEQLRDAWREKAKLEVERALIIQAIFSKEQLGISQGELNFELAQMAREYEVEPEQMLVLLRENKSIDELQFRTIARKVGSFLLESCTAPSA